MQAVGGEFGFSVVLGSQLIGGVVAMVFGLFYDKVRRFFPPLVTGTVIFTIGVSLYPTAIKYIAGGVGTPGFGSAQNWLVGPLVSPTSRRASPRSARSSSPCSLAALPRFPLA